MSDIQKIHNEFCLHQAKNEHAAIVSILIPLLDCNNLEKEELGWAFWNICDRLALQRKWDEQIGFQKRFFEFIEKVLGPDYLHWVVSDGTQAMSLISGGYIEDWVRWYDHANRIAKGTAANRGIRFESHRAFVSSFTRFGEAELALNALNALEALLDEDPAWANKDFAVCTYHTLRFDYLDLIGNQDELIEEGDQFAKYTAEWVTRFEKNGSIRSESESILGSWEQLNQLRPPSSVITALGNAGCALCRARQYELCLHFLNEASRLGFQRNAYSNTLYIIALWKIEQNEESITKILESDPRLLAEHLHKHAPDLVEFAQ